MASPQRSARALLVPLGALLALISTPSAAHDMWLAPERFVVARGEPLRARLLVGEALAPEQSKPYQAARTPELRLHHARRSTDLRPEIHDGADPFLGEVRLRGRGEHLVAVRRDWASISLPPERFLEYVTHEGIAAQVGDPTALSGAQRERYRRSIKSLVRVGGGRGGRLHARVLGQPLEVVLIDAPAKLGVGGRLRARLLLAGQPLPIHPLTAHVRDGAGKVTTQTQITDAGGVASFAVAGDGTWLVKAVHMSRCGDCSGAQWQSEWTAFTFAVGSSSVTR
ncbi:MAG: DUF4198 domain-containing protein [Deltaproteobacteria bacterium]|nr:DUF4198 domain-containing protein [Nannocystaceae bacterium]